jgi:predicted GH43/DUF377 family glycosyl hydrolase
MYEIKLMNIFQRSSKNPVLKPNPKNDWEAFKLYNPGAIFDGQNYHLFYRAMNRGENWQSTIGHAISEDGENFTRFNEPALKPETDLEKRGLEDPRVTKIGDEYFMAYGAYDGNDVRLNIATSKDLMTWEKRGPALNDFQFLKNGGHRNYCRNGQIENGDERLVGKERSKSGAIFSEKINGKYWMLFGEFNIWLASSDDGLKWDVPAKPFLINREGDFFDNGFLEMGPPPIKIDKGWLVLYHGIDKYNVYRLGFLLLDLDNPEKISYRLPGPIFEPQEAYELSGVIDVLPGGLDIMQTLNDAELKEYLAKCVKDKTMAGVIFCCGAVLTGDDLKIFYGAGDSVIGTATAKLSDILNLCPSN